jgi:hypothetical protein
MPYYLYKVFPFFRLERVAAFDAFKEASDQAKALRADPALAADCRVRVMFAENELRAEELLTAIPESRPRTGDDD